MNRNTTPYANSLFEQPWWLDIVAPGRWDEAIVKDGDDVIARLPYCFDKGNIVMPPLTQTLGPWINPEFRKRVRGNSQLGKQKEIINELIIQLPKYKSFKMCFDCSNEYVLPYRWKGFRYEPSFSYRFSDIEDLNSIFSRFHKQVQKNIMKSEKDSIISNDNDSDLLIDLMDKTFLAQGRKNPVDRQLIHRIVDNCSNNNHGKMFVARDKNLNVQVCAFLVYDENVAYALLSGSDPVFRGSGSKSLIYWKEIVFAHQNSKQFDFEGSNIEGIENIIRQFGSDYVINYNVMSQSLFRDTIDLIKPRIKKIIGYKN